MNDVRLFAEHGELLRMNGEFIDYITYVEEKIEANEMPLKFDDWMDAKEKQEG